MAEISVPEALAVGVAFPAAPIAGSTAIRGVSFGETARDALVAAESVAAGTEPVANEHAAELIDQCSTSASGVDVLGCLLDAAGVAHSGETTNIAFAVGLGVVAVGGFAFAGISHFVRSRRTVRS